MRLILVLLFVTLSVIGPRSSIAKENSKPSYQKAEIYFLGWEVDTRASLTIQNLREIATVKLVLMPGSELDNLLRLLKLDALTASDGRTEDARLVVDLFSADGVVKTVYASPFNLLNDDSSRKRIIDRKFKDSFRFFQNVDRSTK